MPTFPVRESKVQQLAARMARLGIHESDIDEQFVRGSGAGGQKINKTSSTVVLMHRPTGIQVRCQESRQQALNRYLARVMLVDLIERKLLGEKSAHAAAVEKLRRQKRKRSKRAKAKMLDGKSQHGHTKKERRRVDPSSD